MAQPSTYDVASVPAICHSLQVTVSPQSRLADSVNSVPDFHDAMIQQIPQDRHLLVLYMMHELRALLISRVETSIHMY